MGVLLLLMTIGGLILAAILLIISFLTKKTWLRKFVFVCVPLWFVFYATALFYFSLTSKERVLSLNEPKEFCGFYLDCHLHAGITDVRTAKIIGSQTAQGTFLIAKIKVFIDAKNPNIAFRLLEPKAEIADEGGRIYSRRLEAENELPTAQTQLNQDIKGNQIIEKEIVFDITEPTNKFKLSITEGYGVDKIIEAFLVGDDDSIFHQPTVFGIETFSQTASLN
jgi:hypothetical protein